MASNKLSENELLSIINAYRRTSLGYEDGDLSNDRAKALDHYHGRPYGDEKEGRSQVVSKDLSETLDWEIPQLMRLFIQSGNVAEFTPEGPEDEELAQQESDYVNYVIMQENDGFMLLHDVIKECRLLKNAYVKHFWEEVEKTSVHEYAGLTEDELLKLSMDLSIDGSEVQVKEQEQRFEYLEGVEFPVYDIKFEVTRKTGRVCLIPVPVEEVNVSRECTGSIQDAHYVEHKTKKTRSDLLEMGMPRDFVSQLSAFHEDEHDEIVYARDSVEDESEDELGSMYDRSMDEIEYCESYLRVDYDGDGKAELRKVITAGGQLPPGDDWNEEIDVIPMTGFVAKRIPHRHIGESLDDELSDLQKINTVLLRQMLDNIYNTNNQQWLVNGRVHLPDFLKSLPGGVKRVMDDEPVAGAAEPVQTTPILQQILPAIDHINTIKENRTGINRANTGLDAELLRQSTKGAYLEQVNRSTQKIEMLARLIGNGLKEMVIRVHELLIKHQDKPKVVKLRGRYVQVDPQSWRDRTSVSVRVGLGVGSEEEKRNKLMMLGDAQEKIAQMGLVGPQQGYNLFGDLVKALGFDAPEKYAMDPESEEFQQMMAQMQNQKQANPLAEVEQIKGQYKLEADRMKMEFDSQVEQMKQRHQYEMDLLKQQMEFNNQERERQSREAIEIMKSEVKAMIEGFKTDIGKPGIGAEVSE